MSGLEASCLENGNQMDEIQNDRVSQAYRRIVLAKTAGKNSRPQQTHLALAIHREAAWHACGNLNTMVNAARIRQCLKERH